MKKAQIAMQFNWIFVFIVGAVILIFFLYIIKSQTKEADTELAASIIKNLDTVVKSSEQKAGTLKLIKIPDVTIQFVCEDGVSFYDLGNGIRKDIPYDIIFSQSKLSGNQLISWTQSWDLPFRIGFFQYLTTRKAQFIVVDDGQFAPELLKILPKNITVKSIGPSDDIPDFNYDYYKIIEFSTHPHTGDKPAENVHNITINTTDLKSHGEVSFDGAPAVKYLKEEALLGAIFAEDEEFYKCTMDKAFDRLQTLMDLNYKRTLNISREISDERCLMLYGFIEEKINEITSNPTLENSESIYLHSKQIARDNLNLIRSKNCPIIY
ncbi:hypothetical protein HQ533_01375 [Candidatus Woesearchaeota archaeon]|nr:hypothetical protein [Candidatus Woesearchaeota archaeon]